MQLHKTLGLLIVAATLSACASSSKNLYAWGNYEEALFVNYHEPAVKEDMLNNYIRFVEQHDVGAKRLAPGLYAEAGTFMLERNDRDAAIAFYEMERDTWPESEALMTTLITNLSARAE